MMILESRPYLHVEHQSRTDFDASIDPDSVSRPRAATMTIHGRVTAAGELPVTDSQGHVARVGLRIRDAASWDILAETRGELAQDADAAGGVTFEAILHGYGLRPELNRLSAGLVVDPIAWYAQMNRLLRPVVQGGIGALLQNSAKRPHLALAPPPATRSFGQTIRTS